MIPSQGMSRFRISDSIFSTSAPDIIAGDYFAAFSPGDMPRQPSPLTRGHHLGRSVGEGEAGVRLDPSERPNLTQLGHSGVAGQRPSCFDLGSRRMCPVPVR
jgi:hypothetical protein